MYVKPEVGLNERNAFIDNLRESNARETQKIYDDTSNLGTNVPSSMGGLDGGSNYFTSRYQTPQFESLVGKLRANMQSQALSEALSNEIAKAQKRYYDVKRAYNNKEYNDSKKSSGGSGSSSSDDYLDRLASMMTNSGKQGDVQETGYVGPEEEEVEVEDGGNSGNSLLRNIGMGIHSGATTALANSALFGISPLLGAAYNSYNIGRGIYKGFDPDARDPFKDAVSYLLGNGNGE